VIKIDWIATRFYLHAFALGRGLKKGRWREGKGKSKRKGFYYMQF